MKLSEILARFKTDVETAVAVVDGVTVLTNVYDERAMNDKTIVINFDPVGKADSPRPFTNIDVYSCSVDYFEANRINQLAYKAILNIRNVPGLNLTAIQYPEVDAVFSDYTLVSSQFRVAYDFED